MTGTGATAHEVLGMLQRHYLPEGRQPGGIFAPEIQAPLGTRRADLIWQPVTNADAGVLIGHEIKVSRTDVLVELADPTKADPWQRYCDRWWLVLAHPDLVGGLELPPSWGVLAPPSGRRTRSMTVVRPAPELKPVNKAPAYETIARWLHWRHYRQGLDLRSREQDAQRLRQINSDLHRRVGHQSPAVDRRVRLVEEVLRKLDTADHAGRAGLHHLQTDDLVAALLDLSTVYQRAEAMAYTAEGVARHAAALQKAIPGRPLAELKAAAENLRRRGGAVA